MRLVLAVGWLAAALAAAKAGDDPNAPLRPSPRVLADPPAWYSPLLFTPKAAPRPGEWMAEHPEPEQSFQQYVAAQPIRPTRARHTIILAPLGPMEAAEQARLDALREFLALYYTLPVRIGPALGLDGVTRRDDPRWILIVGLAVFGAGYALVRYRDAIGNATGYFARGTYVSARTPGWLLLPFGVLMMLGGATMVVGSLYMILFG